MQRRTQQRQHDNAHRQRADRRINTVPDFRGEKSGQGAF